MAKEVGTTRHRSIGSLNARLLIQVADGEPVELGTMSIPIEVTGFGSRGIGGVSVSQESVTASIADALEQGTKALREQR